LQLLFCDHNIGPFVIIYYYHHRRHWGRCHAIWRTSVKTVSNITTDLKGIITVPLVLRSMHISFISSPCRSSPLLIGWFCSMLRMCICDWEPIKSGKLRNSRKMRIKKLWWYQSNFSWSARRFLCNLISINLADEWRTLLTNRVTHKVIITHLLYRMTSSLLLSVGFQISKTEWIGFGRIYSSIHEWDPGIFYH